MPIVHKDKAYIADKLVEKITSYHVRHSLFIIPLPDWFRDITGIENVTGESRNDVDDAWRKAVHDFENKSSTTRRIIAWEIKMAAYIWRGGRCVWSNQQEMGAAAGG